MNRPLHRASPEVLAVYEALQHFAAFLQSCEMTAVGFEATQLARVELESTPLDHSGKLS